MGIVEALGIAVLFLLAGLILIYARRQIISRRGGTIEMSMRLSTYVPRRGWAPGLGRFTPDELRWYRVFSFGMRPRRVLRRHGLVVEERRRPEGAERLAMPEGWVIVRCRPVVTASPYRAGMAGRGTAGTAGTRAAGTRAAETRAAETRAAETHAAETHAAGAGGEAMAGAAGQRAGGAPSAALSGAGPTVELALAEAALTGFLSWLESAPPRALRPR